MIKKRIAGFGEKLNSRKLWMAVAVLAIGIIFHLNGMLDKEMVTLLALVYIGYTAGNIGAKFAYMKYG